MSDIKSTIDQQIASAPIVIYMKGTPDFPQCGFSATVVQIFKQLGKPFKSFNVLEDPALRDGIKVYSNWPTVPQIYIGGKFVGGCDIAKELYSRGDLQKLVDQTQN